MKIALAFSGLPRFCSQTLDNWKNIIAKYNLDVFIHSWKYDPLFSHFNPKKLMIEELPCIETDLYPDRHWPNIDVYRSQCMWKSMYESYKLISVPQNYDIIVRARTDWYAKDLEFFVTNGIKIPWDDDKLILKFKYQNMNICGVNDHFAYGSPELMEKYFSISSDIYSLYHNENVDYCPENFLAAFLYKHNIPVIFQKIDHRLIK